MQKNNGTEFTTLWCIPHQPLDVHASNLHQLQDAILSIWANISKECFQHLVEPIPRKIGSSEGERGSNTVLVWCS